MNKRIITIKPGQTVEIRMESDKETEKEYFTIQEIADKVGLNYYSIHRHIKQGLLKVEKVGRSNRVSVENLNNYIKSRK